MIEVSFFLLCGAAVVWITVALFRMRRDNREVRKDERGRGKVSKAELAEYKEAR